MANIFIIQQVMDQEKYQDEDEQHGKGENISETSSRMEQNSNIHYNRNKKIIFWLYLLLSALFVGSQGYLVARNWNQMQNFYQSDSFFYSNQVAFDWKQGFVTDVLVTSAVDCPTGYQHAVEFNWPGTGFGCYCQPNVNSSFVLAGYCTPLLIESSCRNVQSEDERWANNWRNSSNICLKRSPVSFANQKKYDGQNKICGNSQSLVIVPQSEPCPLVNLTFTLPSLEDHFTVMADPDSLLNSLYASYNATSPYSFYSYPITKFAVSQHQFCLVDEDSGLSPGHQEFVLLNYQRECEDEGSYQSLDEMNEITFYENNLALDQLADIDGFPKPGNWNYKLGFSSLPSWTYYCRHNYDGKFSIPRAIKILNFNFFQGYYYIALVEILLLALVGGQVFVLALRRILKKQVYPTGYKQVYLPRDFCLALTRYIIDLASKLVIFALAFYSTWVCIVNWNWFKTAINLDCADKSSTMVTHVMEPFRDMYQYGIILLIGQMIVLVFVACVDIVHFCYIYKNQLHYYLVNPFEKQFVELEQDKDLDWVQRQNNNLMTDHKMLKVEDYVDDGENPDNTSEKFRITMALNGFDNDRSIEEEIPSRGKVLKKKKKKIGGFKKEEKKENGNLNSIGLSDQFNPYSLEDNSIIAMNSMDSLNPGRNRNQPQREIVDLDEEEVIRNRKRARGRGRGRK